MLQLRYTVRIVCNPAWRARLKDGDRFTLSGTVQERRPGALKRLWNRRFPALRPWQMRETRKIQIGPMTALIYRVDRAAPRPASK